MEVTGQLERKRLIRIAFYIPDKKMDKMNFHSFINYVKTIPEIELIRFNPLENIDYDQNKPIDLLLHKVTDEIVAYEQKGDKVMGTLVANLEKFLKEHPNIVDIDPVIHQKKSFRSKCDRKSIKYNRVTTSKRTFDSNAQTNIGRESTKS